MRALVTTLGLCLVCTLDAVAGQAPHTRVPDWEGTWEGTLVNLPEAPGFRPVQVTMEVGRFPSADGVCATLRSTYREDGQVKAVKDYRLCRGTGPDDLFVDEGDGLKLTSRVIDGALITPFKYDSTLLISTMAIRGETLVEEILTIADKPAVQGPLALKPLAIQRVTLRRAGLPR
jgi:hypothetical protein